MKIAQRVSKGDNVPMQDHRFLAEFDSSLYKTALKASMVAENDNPEDHESLIDELAATEQAKAGAVSQNYEQGKQDEPSSSVDITVDGVAAPTTTLV